jgi:hypothetical protein
MLVSTQGRHIDYSHCIFHDFLRAFLSKYFNIAVNYAHIASFQSLSISILTVAQILAAIIFLVADGIVEELQTDE